MPDDRNDEVPRYRAIFENLPPLQREVFDLHCIEELSFEEIAVRFLVSVETVQQALAAALVTIDSALDAVWGGGDVSA